MSSLGRCGLFLISALLVVAISADDRRESFRGCITFSTVVEPIHPGVTEEDIAAYGTGFKKCFGGNGDTWSEWQGAAAEWEIFVAGENRSYTKMRGEEGKLRAVDWTIEERQLIRSTVEASADTVLGRALRVVTLYYSDGTHTRYWFDPTIYQEPALLAGVKLAHLDRYAALARSPTLRYVRHTPLWTMTHEATSIDFGEAPQELFEVPDLPAVPF